MKYLVGFGIGVLATMFFPDLVPYIKSAFIESGARDTAITTLQNVK
tara:strand:- start:241 stop:378 length:138 start_codon:yes stop_codon:yes gene_type:complete